MIVRKLRNKNSWSQEQLAEFCGLNIRTIQRVESGNKASIETLKCLASVFEVNISTLTEEITVIDKESEKWKALPWWFRFQMFGTGTKRTTLILEFLALFIGFSFWYMDPNVAAVMFLGAYFTGWLVRYGDHKEIW